MRQASEEATEDSGEKHSNQGENECRWYGRNGELDKEDDHAAESHLDVDNDDSLFLAHTFLPSVAE